MEIIIIKRNRRKPGGFLLVVNDREYYSGFVTFTPTGVNVLEARRLVDVVRMSKALKSSGYEQVKEIEGVV